MIQLFFGQFSQNYWHKHYKEFSFTLNRITEYIHLNFKKKKKKITLDEKSLEKIQGCKHIPNQVKWSIVSEKL